MVSQTQVLMIAAIRQWYPSAPDKGVDPKGFGGQLALLAAAMAFARCKYRRQ